ncbi:MFS transporter [Actinophytocola glycyrrhizae]|uniref:MFS transporter n=1 Tax=Actinophytocola glycyrrhizae TaxID=2044873 RepID=A0ABV9RUX3_9PSEU
MANQKALPPYWAVVLTASGANFLAMLDSTVTMLAVPALQRDFPSSSLPELALVVGAYAVLFAALLAPAGRLADTMGRKRVLLGGVALFTMASVLCALAPTVPLLVAARAVQGIGAAVMVPASLSVLLLDTPPKRRMMSISLLSAAGAIAAAVGPSVGGLLVEAFTWHAVFLINVPLGIALIVVGAKVLTPTPARSGLPDPVGVLLLVLGVGGLTVGITNGSSWAWTSGRTLVCLGAGAVCVWLAVRRSLRHPSPAVELSLFRRNRMFTSANLVALLYGTVMYTWLLVSVLFLTDVWQYSELAAGLAQTPGAVVAAIAAVVMGKVMGRFGGPRYAAAVGMTAHALVPVILFVFLTEDSAFAALWLPCSVLVGFGIGATMTAVMTAGAMSAPPTEFASVSAVNNTARQIGGALGAAVVATILRTTAVGDEAGGATLDSYLDVYAFCLVLTVVAIAVAVFGLRTRGPSASVPTEDARRTPARVAD